MSLHIICRRVDPVARGEEYFGVDPSQLSRPFVLGAQSFDPGLPSIAQWGAASSFGLDNLDHIEGNAWHDWRACLHRLGGGWVVPIIEQAKESGELAPAVRQILEQAATQAHRV